MAGFGNFWGFLWERHVSSRSGRLRSMSTADNSTAEPARNRFISRPKGSSCCRSSSRLDHGPSPSGNFTKRLWPATFVSEATLSSLVAEVRNALGERGRQAHFVRTLHGYGYSFAAHASAPESNVGAISNWVVYEGREIALADGEHILGRDTDAKVELRSPAVSRHHARIVIHGAAATLEDLRSKNGTMVGVRTVTAPVPLVDGDEIRIGGFVLRFRTVSAKGSTKTAPHS